MQEIVLETSCGPIRGTVHGGTMIFRGIDYARCERFAPAIPVESWEGTYDARDYGTVCPQRSCRLASVIGADKGAYIDEHRLCLSVYAPEGARDLPVMVWIHGGAFVTGGSEEKRYSGERLVAEGNVIVVKISYRLGALGYLWMPGKGAANLGLEDQRTALEWIRRNISGFGGDPDNITVFGQSAGAFSIAALIATSKDRLPMRRAILQSPPLGTSMPEAKAEKIARKFLKVLGKDPFTASIDEILDAQEKIDGKSLSPMFQPIVADATAIPECVPSDFEIVCGHTEHETSPFLRKILGRSLGRPLGRAVVRASSDNVFVKPARAYLEKYGKLGISATEYHLTWHPEGNPLGSCHCIEMPFLLGFREDWKDSAMMQVTPHGEFERISRIFLRAWTGFANGKGFPDIASAIDTAQRKQALRKQMEVLRSSTTQSQAAESEAIAKAIMQLPQWQDAKTVLLYNSINAEVDTSLLLSAQGKRILLPVVEGDSLVLREYRKDSLVPGYKGIMEPSSDCPSADPAMVDLALVPGVAFDRRYHRLGRGKGFYDRLLPLLSCPVIGMGFSWQVVDSVPVESHDILLSGVVTPEGLV